MLAAAVGVLLVTSGSAQAPRGSRHDVSARTPAAPPTVSWPTNGGSLSNQPNVDTPEAALQPSLRRT